MYVYENGKETRQFGPKMVMKQHECQQRLMIPQWPVDEKLVYD
jgi:hypothetical protein